MPVYYVFGNHDKGLYDSKCTRGFTGDDLAAELTANGVHVLEDEIVPIGDAFWAHRPSGRLRGAGPRRRPQHPWLS